MKGHCWMGWGQGVNMIGLRGKHGKGSILQIHVWAIYHLKAGGEFFLIKGFWLNILKWGRMGWGKGAQQMVSSYKVKLHIIWKLLISSFYIWGSNFNMKGQLMIWPVTLVHLECLPSGNRVKSDSHGLFLHRLALSHWLLVLQISQKVWEIGTLVGTPVVLQTYRKLYMGFHFTP